MKSTELRIGNWYNEFSIPKQATVDLISKLEHIELNGKIAIDVTPIPLTEEWLLKFGFEKVSADYVSYNLKAAEDVYIVYADDYSCGLFNSKESEEEELGVIPNWETIKHVHQLQNLYFALTGEELTIK
jgi:hypothetical protein